MSQKNEYAKLKCLQGFKDAHGHIRPGDVFWVGYKHERVNGKLEKRERVLYITPTTVGPEMVQSGRAAKLQDEPEEVQNESEQHKHEDELHE